MIVTTGQLAEWRRQERARDRALLQVIQIMIHRDRWLRQRLAELNQRVRALDGITPEAPPWPPLEIPPEPEGLLETED